jgi:dihydropteroate synthase
MKQLQEKGIDRQRVILDPGFGFGKTIPQNYRLLHYLNIFADMGTTLAGLSRKSMIWKVLETTPQESLTGTIALNMLALTNGATCLRVHDVKEAVATVKLYKEYKRN